MASGCPREQIETLKSRFGFREPDRGNLEDPLINWRTGKPDYTKANLAFMAGKTQNHSAGSLEEIVENLVKTWEMEASHKQDLDQWQTVDHGNYKVQVNGGQELDGAKAKEMGNYNFLLMNSKSYLKFGQLDFEESHDLFRYISYLLFPKPFWI